MGATSSQVDMPQKSEKPPQIKQSHLIQHSRKASVGMQRFSFGTGDVSMIVPSINETASPDQPRPIRKPTSIQSQKKSRKDGDSGQMNFWESLCLAKGSTNSTQQNSIRHQRQSSRFEDNLFLSNKDAVHYDICQNPQLRSSRLNNSKYLSCMSPKS